MARTARSSERDANLLVGVRPRFKRLIAPIRVQWPRFMYVRTMMVGCVAGEGQLDDGSDSARAARAKLLVKAIVRYAHALSLGQQTLAHQSS